MSRSFDPRPHLRQLANGAPHLDVKWRLQWLRSEHPDAEIDTNLVSVEGDVVICRVAVRLPGGGSASAHGAASRSGGVSMADLIERAEQRALGRALASLGFGAQYLEEDAGVSARPAQSQGQSQGQPQAAPPPVPTRDIYDDVPSSDPAPRQRSAAETSRTYDDMEPAPRAERTPSPRESRERERERERNMEARQPREQRPTPDRGERYERQDRGERPERAERAERPMRQERDERYEQPPRQQRPERAERMEQREPDEPDGPVQMPPMRRGSELRGHDAPRMGETPAREDVAWQRFWEWARARGYRDAEHLRELLGVEVLALTPREVRDLIRRYELDHQPGVEDDL